jgi:transcription initiation factor TFIIIB Brf1 subunit/transcription initiation factor TFIIB
MIKGNTLVRITCPECRTRMSRSYTRHAIRNLARIEIICACCGFIVEVDTDSLGEETKKEISAKMEPGTAAARRFIHT